MTPGARASPHSASRRPGTAVPPADGARTDKEAEMTTRQQEQQEQEEQQEQQEQGEQEAHGTGEPAGATAAGRS
ncbi:hypothetical protein GTW46_11320 [Streptomyces sp. SID6013]|nr:hypothetical protein [Streptomyces sp. SID6013]